MRSIEANRQALAAHGARVELCACGGQILAINDPMGVLDAVTAHRRQRIHLRWVHEIEGRREGRCGWAIRAIEPCALRAGHRHAHRPRTYVDGSSARTAAWRTAQRERVAS